MIDKQKQCTTSVSRIHTLALPVHCTDHKNYILFIDIASIFYKMSNYIETSFLCRVRSCGWKGTRVCRPGTTTVQCCTTVPQYSWMHEITSCTATALSHTCAHSSTIQPCRMLSLLSSSSHSGLRYTVL